MVNMTQNTQQDTYPGAPSGEDPAEAGRGTDTVMAHMSLGEVVIPRAFLDDPNVMQALQALFQQNGADIAQYTVGEQANSINPETGYPEFGWWKQWKKLDPIWNIGNGWAPFRDSLESAAVLAGNYFLPGSSMLTSHLVSDGAQNSLNSSVGRLFNAGMGAAGAGVGSSITNVPSASDLGYGWGSAGTSVAEGFGPNAASSVQGGEGLLGGASRATGIGSNSLPSFGSGLTGSGNAGAGMSSYGKGLGSLFSGIYDISSNNDAKKALLESQGRSYAALQPYLNAKFQPGDLTQDPGYQFRLQQGQQAIDRSLGARGNLFSGNALKAAQEYGQGLADSTYNDAYQRWLQQNAQNIGAAGMAGNIYDNQGMIQAQNAYDNSDAVNKMLSGFYW